MPRMAMSCVIAALAAIALSTGGVSAATLTLHTQTPKVKVATPKVEVNPQPLPPNAVGMSTGAQYRVKTKFPWLNGPGKDAWLEAPGNGSPQDNVSINYSKIKIQYQNQTTGSGSHHKH